MREDAWQRQTTISGVGLTRVEVQITEAELAKLFDKVVVGGLWCDRGGSAIVEGKKRVARTVWGGSC